MHRSGEEELFDFSSDIDEVKEDVKEDLSFDDDFKFMDEAKAKFDKDFDLMADTDDLLESIEEDINSFEGRLLIGSSPNVETSDLVEIDNSSVALVDVEKSVELVMTSNSTTLQEFQESCDRFFDNVPRSNEDLVSRFVNNKPDFISIQQVSIIMQNVDKIERTDRYLDSLIDKLNLKDVLSDKPMLRFKLTEFVEECVKVVRLTKFGLESKSTENVSNSEQLKAVMLRDQIDGGTIDYNNPSGKFEVIDSATITTRQVSCMCSCGDEIIADGNLVSFIKLPNGVIKESFRVMRCSNCGTYRVLDSRGVEKLKTIITESVKDLSPLGSPRRVPSMIVYSPTFHELNTAFPGVFEFVKEDKDDSYSIPVNWEEECALFRETLDLFHSKKKVNYNKPLGIKSIAKLVSGTSNSYEDLKERATSTLLQELDKSLLQELSPVCRYYLTIPSYYKGKFSGFELDLASLGFTDSVDPFRTKVLDESKFEKDFNAYCDYLLEIESEVDKYLADLMKYSRLFSSMSITNSRLDQDLVNRYLGDPKVASCIDYLTDLMIISNLAENFLVNFSPRRREGDIKTKVVNEETEGSAKREASYAKRLSSILDINQSSKLRDKLASFTEYFDLKIAESSGLVKGLLNPSDFILFFSSDTEFYSLLYKLAKTMLDGDYYESSIIKDVLETTFKYHLKNLKDSETSNRKDLVDIAKLVAQIPVIDKNKFPTKFSYYFRGEEDLIEEEKSELIKLFLKSKISPKKLEGDSFSEKKSYYLSINKSDRLAVEPHKDFYDVVKSNYVLLKSLDVLGHAQPDQFIMYMLSRDLLFMFKDLSFDDLCLCLYLNKDIASFYLESEFNYEVKDVTLIEFMKRLHFKSTVLEEIFRDSDISDEDLIYEAKQNSKRLLDEFKDIPEILEKVKQFLDKCAEEGD